MSIGKLLCKIIHETYPEKTPKEAYLFAKRWIHFPSRLLGNCCPIELIDAGRSHKVLGLLQAIDNGDL